MQGARERGYPPAPQRSATATDLPEPQTLTAWWGVRPLSNVTAARIYSIPWRPAYDYLRKMIQCYASLTVQILFALSLTPWWYDKGKDVVDIKWKVNYWPAGNAPRAPTTHHHPQRSPRWFSEPTAKTYLMVFVVGLLYTKNLRSP